MDTIFDVRSLRGDTSSAVFGRGGLVAVVEMVRTEDVSTLGHVTRVRPPGH